MKLSVVVYLGWEVLACTVWFNENGTVLGFPNIVHCILNFALSSRYSYVPCTCLRLDTPRC